MGFSWSVNGKISDYVYNSLPNGISSAGLIFTRVTRVVLAHVRSQGFKIVMFSDEGIGGNENVDEEVRLASTFTRSTLSEIGILIAEGKCSWQNSRKDVWLGCVFDFVSNRLCITEERIDSLLKSIDLMFEKI